MTQEEFAALTLGQIVQFLPPEAHQAVDLAATRYEAAVLRQQLAVAQADRVGGDELAPVHDLEAVQPPPDGEPVDAGPGDVEGAPPTA